MKKILVYCILLKGSVCMCQVGINTRSPKSMLDVKGNVGFHNELRVGGNTGNAGNTGQDNQVLVSRGSGQSPVWKDFKQGFYSDGSYQNTASFVGTDDTGMNLGSTLSNTKKVDVGEDISNGWTVLSGIGGSFKIKNPSNRVDVMFQTGAEISQNSNTTSNPTNDRGVKFSCGVFLNKKLVAMRAQEIIAYSGKTGNNIGNFMIVYVLEDRPAGDYDLKVGCKRLNNNNQDQNYTLAIGRSIASNANRSFILRSVERINISEKVLSQAELEAAGSAHDPGESE